MLVWNFGRPLLQGFSNKPQKGYIEVEPDAGVPFRRLKFSDIQDLASCTFTLNRTDYIRFMSWYKHELRQGTIPFSIWDCRYKIQRVARIVGDVPTYSTNSNYYDITVTLAFESSIEVFNWNLLANDDALIVNDNDHLLVGVELRL